MPDGSLGDCSCSVWGSTRGQVGAYIVARLRGSHVIGGDLVAAFTRDKL